MCHFISMLLISSFFVSSTVVYADTEQLNSILLKNNCLACHTIDKRKYGPILREVSKKYAGDATAANKLVAKIRAGGTGVWGKDIMPPQLLISDAELKQTVELILSLPAE